MPIFGQDNFGRALRILDDIWEETCASGTGDATVARPTDRLPDISHANTVRRSALARVLLERMNAIDLAALPYDLGLTLEVGRHVVRRWEREDELYWLLFDPTGEGYFAMFAPTAYAGGYLLGMIEQTLRNFAFKTEADGHRYIGLVHDYARLIQQILDRTTGQAERGIIMPLPQLEQSVALFRAIHEAALPGLLPATHRLSALGEFDLLADVTKAIERSVAPAFGRLIGLLEDPAYAAAAPAEVGLSQYPGGPEAYDELIRLHTTLELGATDIHTIGHARIAEIRRAMEALLAEVGFAGTPEAYLQSLQSQPAWRVSDKAGVAAFFERYIARIAPHIADNFGIRPIADHSVAPLPDELSDAMTFGYYAPPGNGEQRGLFMFNAANLMRNPVNNIAALNYHELVPGHHFHLSTQKENMALHPLRQHSSFNAYNEGWAEYAATFAGELGMYEEPQEKFGRMMMDSFLTCRLVVDTGMNALGWSLERARDFMRSNSFMPENEIRSESLRYSCDVPGQALAYKLGDTFLLEARERMRDALGENFRLQLFHDAVLAPGALPFPLLEHHLKGETDRLLRESAVVSRH